MSPAPTVAVIGGGISGLAAAWELTSSAPPGTRIVVFEASDRVGGNLRSADIGGRTVDTGADAFLARRPEAIDLCAEIGLSESLVAPSGASASVWARRALRKLPAGLVLGVPTQLVPLARSGILSPFGLAYAGLDLLRPARAPGATSSARDAPDARDRSVGDLVKERLGNEVRDLIAGPLVGGINAGRVETLSAQAVFPALIEAAARGGSLMRALRPSGPSRDGPVFLTPIDGMASLPDILAAALITRGVELRLSEPVDRLERVEEAWVVSTGDSTRELLADGVIIATPAGQAAALITGVDAPIAGGLKTMTSASVALVTFLLDRATVAAPLDGTGFLVPQIGGGLVTACTFLSTKWAHLAQDGRVLIRASAGRAGDDRAISMSDDDLVSKVLGELERMLGGLGQPLEVLVTRFVDSFPQYLVGHLGRVDAIETAASALRPPLALAGASYRGIGVPACIASGRRAAKAVAGRLSEPAARTTPA